MQVARVDPFFKRLAIVVAIIIALYILYLLIPVIVPFFSAFILAYLFNPIVTKMSRIMPRWLAIIFVYAALILGFGILLWWLLPTLWHQIQAAIEYMPRMVQWYNEDFRTWINGFSQFNLPALDTQVVSNTFIEYLNKNYNVEDAQSFVQQVLSSGMMVINNAGLVVLVPILMFYFLFNWDERIKTWREALPAGSKDKIIEITHDCDEALMAFVKGQLLVMILLGVVYAVQLQLIGLELGLIIGMVAGVASFVPYLGFGIGFIAAIIAGFFQFGVDWVKIGLIVGAFVVGQAVEGYVLQPLLLGDKIGLSPLWVIFAVLAGAGLMGFVGMLIALPVSAILNVLFNHAYAAYTQTNFYKGRKQYQLFK
ncbi:AI-2E family transporter [Psychrobacter sp. FDAARGOS_221]|uniref:AI-2E family transporter n=1 Tax=Psychrobacter sp. FDAARGOS_221 TaxID=1975705 RepID=UPI000BB587C9|nr:AI-2E family transporter [Psychrobacter sp. FDAARGOS_221]PNK59757.1 AI-2E family transporter [Psychrobacter sp. FDAARGOS_221]